MHILEVSYKMALKVWWSFFWRLFLVAFGIGFGVGVLVTALNMVLATPIDAQAPLFQLLLWVFCTVLSGTYAMRKVLYKRFGNFSVVCVADQPEAVERSIP